MKKYLIILGLLLIVQNLSHAQVATWINPFTGQGDGHSWHDPQNWGLNHVPLANEVASIDYQTEEIVVSTSAVFLGMNVNNSVIRITPSGKMTLSHANLNQYVEQFGISRNSKIINRGEILVKDTTTRGIYVGVDCELINYGKIKVTNFCTGPNSCTSDIYRVALFVSDKGYFHNTEQGILQMDYQYSAPDMDGIFVNGFGASLLNEGLIEIDGLNTDESNSIMNWGTIENSETGVIEITDAGEIGFNNRSSLSSIENNGDIIITGNNLVTGILISELSVLSGYGTIETPHSMNSTSIIKDVKGVSGYLTFDGDLSIATEPNKPFSKYIVEFVGNDGPGESNGHDFFAVNGDLFIGDYEELEFKFSPSFTATEEVYHIIEYSGTLTGEFMTQNLPSIFDGYIIDYGTVYPNYISIIPDGLRTKDASLSGCSSDGSFNFNLEQAIPDITLNNSDYTVEFYANEADATAGQNPIPMTYTTETTVIYARSSFEDLSNINKVQLTVNSNPSTQLTEFQRCFIEEQVEIDVTEISREIATDCSCLVSLYANQEDYDQGVKLSGLVMVNELDQWIAELGNNDGTCTVNQTIQFINFETRECNPRDEKCDLAFANSYSPNGDGMNEGFIIFPYYCSGIIKEMTVFDRWGNLIYKGDSAWNSSLQSQEGIFLYHVTYEITDTEGKVEPREHSGTVYLLR